MKPDDAGSRVAKGIEPEFASLADIGALLREGRLSPLFLVEHCLRRIAFLDPRLHAFITVTDDLARHQASTAERELRAGRWRGPLHGVPVAVKDFFDTAGIRTTAAFEGFEHRVPTEDAEMVSRLRDAGAVLLGKTNMHKLGMGTTSVDSYFGAVVNPWNAAHVAGGSSGGSAVAVATGLAFLTVDTDAVGSGRLPAAICGVTCFKPTFGVLSAAGILAGEPPPDPAIPLLSHPCLTARSAHDVSLAFDALTGRASADGRAARRVGVVTNFAATDGVRSSFEQAIEDIRPLGLELSDVTVPFESASFDAEKIQEDRPNANTRLFANLDALVLPTLAAVAPTVDEARATGDLAVSPGNTFFCNYYGLPAISVPIARAAAAVPLGLQLVGPQGADGLVLALAREYQRATSWQYGPPAAARRV
jgi:aspartyl-tRNA(Asn)/glutamyl-tRNA(Gln) amidotransferase subunit A